MTKPAKRLETHLSRAELVDRIENDERFSISGGNIHYQIPGRIVLIGALRTENVQVTVDGQKRLKPRSYIERYDPHNHDKEWQSMAQSGYSQLVTLVRS